MSPPRRRTLVGLLALQSIVCARPAGVSGSLPPWAFPFPVSPSVLLRAPSPVSFETGSSSRELSLPCRVTTDPCLPHRCSTAKRLPWGSVPLRDINRRRPRSRGSQIPLCSVLGVSHALDGLLRHRPCGFISPRSHVQGSLFRGFPPGEAVPSRRRPVPSCR